MKKCLTILLCACLLLGCIPALGALASGQTTAESTGQTTGESTGQTTRPQSASYMPLNPSQGFGGGTFSITMPAQSNATSYSIYWGDAQGNKLPGYTALHTDKITSSSIIAVVSDGFTVPAQAKALLIYTSSEQYGECLVPYKLDLPKITLPGTGKKLAEFVVVSDLHIGRDKIAEKNFVAMLRDVKTTAPNASGIIVVGDAVDSASDANYALFDQLYASVPGAAPIYRGIGDAEYLTPGSYAYDATAHSANLQKFLNHVKAPTGVKLQTQYYTYSLGGCHMVFIGADSYIDGNAVYSDKQINWLQSVLSHISTDEPVFIFMHEPIPETVSGSASLQGYGNVYNFIQMQSTIELHPKAFVFNGHTHWTMEADRTVHVFKSGARAFNTASVASLWNDKGGAGYEIAGSQGYYVTVYEDAVLIRGRDFSTGQWIAQAEFLLSTKKPAETTQTVTTAAPKATTAATTEAQTEPAEESILSELGLPLCILAVMALIAFVIVFRKPRDPET